MTNPRRRSVRVLLRAGATALFLTGALAYAIGLLTLAISEADEACARGLVHEDANFREMRTSLFPLENTCLFEDGFTYAAMPAWVNPLFAGGVVGAAACAATSFWLNRTGKSGS